MPNLTAILSNAEVAYSTNSVTINNEFTNINGLDLLAKLRSVENGEKIGSHFLRTRLKLDIDGKCYPRKNSNIESMARLLIIDCDKHIDSNGEILEGSPDPYKVSQILRDNKIAHVLYGSFSHYTNDKGNRYRIIMATTQSYTKEQLPPTVEAVISQINTYLDNELLASAQENKVFAQPWFIPRKPVNSIVNDLYLEYLDGETIEVVDPVELPPTSNTTRKNIYSNNGEISPIESFNSQNRIEDLLSKYDYKKIYISNDHVRYLSPNSKTNSPGIIVKNNKLFSHHGDELNDGYWHDAFDLMKVTNGFTEAEAIKYAAQNSLAPDGQTVDQYNKKRLASKTIHEKTISTDPIPHNEILNLLIKNIVTIDFRNAARLEKEEKLRNNQTLIIVIENILTLAKQYNWGICRNHNFIYLYNGAYWSFIDDDELEAFLGIAAEKMGVDIYKARYYSFREQLFKQFIALAHLPKPEQPKDIVFVNLKNGTFEITPTSTRLKSFNSKDFITYQLPFEYNPTATAPLFLQYLDRVLPDKKLQNILSEYLGYVFIQPSTLKLEKTLMLYGKGANGKSVFYEIVRSLFGEQNTSEYSLQSLTNENGYFRAMIANKLVNYASEINGKLETATFKQLVSGEPVEARLPYGNPFTITCYAKLIFNCNELPKDVEHTEAFYRRFLIIPFNVTIPEKEQDKQLAKKIIDAELSGIFNWVLMGLKRLLEQKQFTDSETIRHTRAQYEMESDSVRLFLDESNYKPSPSDYIVIKELYYEYRKFCDDDGFKPVNKSNFTKRLENYKITIEKKNIGKVAFVTRC